MGLAELGGGGAHVFAEGFGEGALGVVAEGLADRCDGVGGVEETVAGYEDAPAGEVVDGGEADDFLEAQGEDGAGEAAALRELLECPGVGWVFVHGGDGGVELFVGEGGEPAYAVG